MIKTNKKLQKGFAVIEMAIFVVIIIAVSAIGYWSVSRSKATTTSPIITITDPIGTSSYQQNSTIPIKWKVNQPVAAGEFGVWSRSSANKYYSYTSVKPNNTTSYNTSLALTSEPADNGYQIIIAYRLQPDTGTWTKWATSSGVFTVTPYNANFSFLNVMIAKPTLDSITLLVSTTLSSNITVNYGPSTTYGRSVTSTNQTTHKILISGLSAGSTYHYQLVAAQASNTATNISKSDSTFKTQAQPGTNFTFATISDLQGGDWSSIASRIQTLNPDIIVNAGDSIAGELTTDVASYHTRWQTDVFNYSQNLTNHIASFWAMGNHDFISYYNNKEDKLASYAEFAKILSLPITVGNAKNYYSFDYGDAHFSVIDSSQIEGPLLDGQNWLDNDLKTTKKKWKVVLMHIPSVNPPAGIINTNPTGAKALHTIFKNRGVQIVINGHSHVYHRWVRDGVFYVSNTTVSNVTPWPKPFPVFNDSTGDAGSLSSSLSIFGYTVGKVSASQFTISSYDNDGLLKDTFNIAPNTFEVSSPQNNSHTTNHNPTFVWSASAQIDVYAKPSLALSKYQLYVDGILNRDNIPATATSTTSTRPLSDGPHSWYVIAVNNAGKTQNSNSTYIIKIGTLQPSAVGITNRSSTDGAVVEPMDSNQNKSSAEVTIGNQSGVKGTKQTSAKKSHNNLDILIIIGLILFAASLSTGYFLRKKYKIFHNYDILTRHSSTPSNSKRYLINLNSKNSKRNS
ncbi:MAG: metallophosphoesterase [Candidatus Saccharibacteria bacterium]